MHILSALLPLLRSPFTNSPTTVAYALVLPVARSISRRIMDTEALPSPALLARSRADSCFDMRRKTKWNNSTASVTTKAKRGYATTGLARQRPPTGEGSRVGGGVCLFSSGPVNDDLHIGDARSEWEYVNNDCAWMNVEDLKRALRKRKLKVSGRKEDLIERLRAARKGDPTVELPPGHEGHTTVTKPIVETNRGGRKMPTAVAGVGTAGSAATSTRSTTSTKSSSNTSTTTSDKRPQSVLGAPAARASIYREPTPRARPLEASLPQLRAMSWNVNGLRAILSREEGRQALTGFVATERPDVLGLQETKLQSQHVKKISAQLAELLPDYDTFWHCSGPPARKGYSGTALIVRRTSDTGSQLVRVSHGIGQVEGDAEGRVITAELGAVFVVNVYTPNSGEGLSRLAFRTDMWDQAFAAYVKRLEEIKPVVVIGDFNVCHEDIDFFNPTSKLTLKAAGTTPQERSSFATKLLGQDPPLSCLDETFSRRIEGGLRYDGLSLRDSFRMVHPEVRGVFSYWSTRAGNRPFNRGMRLDYCLVSRVLAARVYEDGEPAVHDAFVLDSATLGLSDHCPVGVVLRL